MSRLKYFMLNYFLCQLHHHMSTMLLHVNSINTHQLHHHMSTMLLHVNSITTHQLHHHMSTILLHVNSITTCQLCYYMSTMLPHVNYVTTCQLSLSLKKSRISKRSQKYRISTSDNDNLQHFEYLHKGMALF
jgi:hypothetical protein